MKRGGALLVAAVSALVFSLSSCAHSRCKCGVTVSRDNCIKKYVIRRDSSPWQGFTSTHEEEEASKKIMALPIEGSDYRPFLTIPGPDRQVINVTGRSEKLRRVAVDSSLFSDLNRADATRRTDERFFIGTYKDAALKYFSPSGLADILLESQVVSTYWHMEAEFCLESEVETEDSYTAHYRGKHVYFTNSRNEEALDFLIIIDKKSRKMFLEAR